MEGSPKTNTENEIEKSKSKIKILKENLREIFDISKYSTFGHGTGKIQAENILKNGLESANNAFDETARAIDNTDESLNKILNWPHRNYKHIVVIMVPNAPTGMGGYSYFDDVFEKLPENRISDPGAGREFKKEYYIQPQFIKGYIDVDSLSFIKNNLYDPEAKVNIKEIPYYGPRHRLTGEPVAEMTEDERKLLSQSNDVDWD